MPNWLRNESQEANEAYENLLKSAGGDYVNATGDTMTGTLEVPTLVNTSLVSGVRLEAGGMVLTSLASVRSLNLGSGTIAGALNLPSLCSLNRVEGKVTSSGIVAGPLFDFYVSGASGTVMKINNIERGYVSTSSCATVSFAIRIDIAGKIYYMPVYLGVA